MTYPKCPSIGVVYQVAVDRPAALPQPTASQRCADIARVESIATNGVEVDVAIPILERFAAAADRNQHCRRTG